MARSPNVVVKLNITVSPQLLYDTGLRNPEPETNNESGACYLTVPIISFRATSRTVFVTPIGMCTTPRLRKKKHVADDDLGAGYPNTERVRVFVFDKKIPLKYWLSLEVYDRPTHLEFYYRDCARSSIPKSHLHNALNYYSFVVVAHVFEVTIILCRRLYF